MTKVGCTKCSSTNSSKNRLRSGKTTINYGGVEIDLGSPFKRVTMIDAVKEYTGVDFDEIKDTEGRAAAPPALDTNIGVSTSKKPCPSKYLRIELIINDLFITVSDYKV